MNVSSLLGEWSYTQAFSWPFFIIFKYKLHFWISSENWRDHKAFDPSLMATPKERQTQGPKKRFMVDNHGGQCSTFLKTEQNRATAPQQSKPLRDSDSQLSCCIPHQGGIGEDGSFWHRIEATKLFPGGAALGQPGSLQGLKLSSMCPMSTATVSLLLHFLCALTRPSGFLNFS